MHAHQSQRLIRGWLGRWAPGAWGGAAGSLAWSRGLTAAGRRAGWGVGGRVRYTRPPTPGGEHKEGSEDQARIPQAWGGGQDVAHRRRNRPAPQEQGPQGTGQAPSWAESGQQLGGACPPLPLACRGEEGRARLLSRGCTSGPSQPPSGPRAGGAKSRKVSFYLRSSFVLHPETRECGHLRSPRFRVREDLRVHLVQDPPFTGRRVRP